jgi:crotonobetainyl-CoA:carnitine CoA-transferase CaiB-like acyl-CoA transferase
MGNRNPGAAPHGVYPCLGEDQWCAIAVFTEEDWETFCHVLSKPDWISHPKFKTVQAINCNEDELDQLIAQWTKHLPADEVMKRFQKVGVSAEVVRDNEGLYHDPQLDYRRHFNKQEHPELGTHTVEALPVKLSAAPVSPQRAAPCLGQDNYGIYTGMLGISDEQYIEFTKRAFSNRILILMRVENDREACR